MYIFLIFGSVISAPWNSFSSIGRSVGRSAIISWKGVEVTIPLLVRSTCLIPWFIGWLSSQKPWTPPPPLHSTPLIHSSMSSTHYCWPVMNMVVIKGHSGIARKKGLRPFSSYLPATTQRQFCRQWVPSKICNNIKKGAPRSARQDNCFIGRTDGQRNL